MLVRNYAKPFCIAGFILAEIYMLLVVLAPVSTHPRRLPVPPLEDTAVQEGAPIPPSYLVKRVLVSAIFFGPFGAAAGLGVGMLFSGARHWWSQRRPAPPP